MKPKQTIKQRKALRKNHKRLRAEDSAPHPSPAALNVLRIAAGLRGEGWCACKWKWSEDLLGSVVERCAYHTAEVDRAYLEGFTDALRGPKPKEAPSPPPGAVEKPEAERVASPEPLQTFKIVAATDGGSLKAGDTFTIKGVYPRKPTAWERFKARARGFVAGLFR